MSRGSRIAAQARKGLGAALWVAIVIVPLPSAVAAVRSYRVTDFQCFYAAARMVMQSDDPYDERSWARELGGPNVYDRDPAEACRPRGRYGYPLWTAVLLAPLSWLPGMVAAAIWVGALLTGVVAGAVLIWRVVRPAESALMYATVVLTSLPFWLTLITAQFGGLMLGLIGAGLWWEARGRSRAGAALALLGVKPHIVWLTLPAIGVWLLARFRGGLIAAGITGLCMVSLSVVLLPGWIGEWLRQVDASQAQLLAFNHTTTWQLAVDLGLPAWTAAIVGLPLVGLLANVVLRSGARLVDVVAASLVASLAASPYVGSYDLILLTVAWGRILAIAVAAAGVWRLLLLGGVVACASVLPWLLYALYSVSLTTSADESPISIVVLATAVALWVALRTSGDSAGPQPARAALS